MSAPGSTGVVAHAPVEATPADLWVFGYGSLMWRPDFPFAERAIATVTGYHRAFCIASTLHRGTPERPGLVLGLDRGRACVGVAYRVACRDVGQVLGYLRARELVYGVYREAFVTATLEAGASVASVPVLAYTVERCHPSYAGTLPMAAQVEAIRGAKGRSGANLDYLINTVRHLQAAGIRERGIERLMTMAAGFSAHSTEGGQHRASVRGLHRAWTRMPGPDLVVPKGDQRRFGHRLRLVACRA